jgi:trigger factor
LKIETKSRDDHQATLIVELEAEQMESAKRRAARGISERKSIPGFRPGKAPFDVVVRTFGMNTIQQEAVDLLLDEVYPEALKESKIEPAGPGALENIENQDNIPTFTFTIPLASTVELGDYHSVRLPYEWQEPGQEKLVAALEDMRQMYAKTETVNRPIQTGDFVMVDLKGYDKKASDDEAPLLERTGFPVFVRKEEKIEEWPFPGFSVQLVGLNVSDEKSFTHKYPEDYTDTSLQAKVVNFKVVVKLVRGTILPELNDDFAKTAGPFADLNALRDALKANLSAQSKADYDDDYFVRLIDRLKEPATIKYAPSTLDHEVEHVMEDIKSRLASQNMDLAAYLKTREMDEEKFLNEEARPAAIKRLERSLLMDELAKSEKLELDKELLNESYKQTWLELQSDQGFQKSMRGKSQPSKQLMNAVARESANRAYIKQTLERMKAIAMGQYPEVPGNDKLVKKAAKKTSGKKTNQKSSSSKVSTGNAKKPVKKTNTKK